MKVFTESLMSEMKVTGTDKSPNALCVLEGPCMQFGNKPNRNNRIYSRKLVEDRILNNQSVQECIKNRSMLGEGGHPENRIDIAYPEVGISCERLWIPEGDGDLLYGRFVILDTPVGRILRTLAEYGTRLGISARAVADSVQKNGHEVILENSYELITFDAVTEPGFKCARLEKVDSVSKSVESMSTKELKESSAALKAFKNPVFESRIRTLDKEICKREHRADFNALNESISRLESILNKSSIKLQNIKYEKDLVSLIKDAKSIISESRKFNDSKNRSISTICTRDTSIDKFNVDRNFNESIDTDNLINKDNSLLEKMCSRFRRNSYE